MSTPCLHVAIVGAGLGGLAAAIGIARAGHEVTVLEQASVLGEVVLVFCYTHFHAYMQSSSRSEQEFKFLQIPPESSSAGVFSTRLNRSPFVR